MEYNEWLPVDEEGPPPPIPSWLSWPLSELVGPACKWLLWCGLLALPPVWSLPLSSPPDFKCSAASIDFRCIPTQGPQWISCWLVSKSSLKPLVLDDWADRDEKKKLILEKNQFSLLFSCLNSSCFCFIVRSIRIIINRIGEPWTRLNDFDTSYNLNQQREWIACVVLNTCNSYEKTIRWLWRWLTNKIHRIESLNDWEKNNYHDQKLDVTSMKNCWQTYPTTTARQIRFPWHFSILFLEGVRNAEPLHRKVHTRP